MQVFKLVNSGFVDQMIAFDSLPERLMKNIRTQKCEGLPRYWAKWLLENGSIRDVLKTETKKIGPGDYEYTYTKIGTEPCMFFLDYKDSNQDRERWQEIGNYVRKAVDVKTRLMDKMEDMAIPMAPNSYESLAIEPEDIPIIQIPKEFEEKKDLDGVVEAGEETMVVAQRKRGRPRKMAVGV